MRVLEDFLKWDVKYILVHVMKNEEKNAAEKLGAELLLMDVTIEDSVKAAAQAMMDKEGRIDILINNAGISGVYKR